MTVERNLGVSGPLCAAAAKRLIVELDPKWCCSSSPHAARERITRRAHPSLLRLLTTAPRVPTLGHIKPPRMDMDGPWLEDLLSFVHCIPTWEAPSPQESRWMHKWDITREQLPQGAPHRKLDHHVMCLAVYYCLPCTCCVHVALQHNTAQHSTARTQNIGHSSACWHAGEHRPSVCARVPCGGGDTHDGLLLPS